MRYYIYINDQKEGPYRISELFEFQKTNRINNDTFVWTEEFTEWISFANLKRSFGGKQPALTKEIRRDFPPKRPEDQFIATFKAFDSPLPINNTQAFSWSHEKTCIALIILSLAFSIFSVFTISKITLAYISAFLLCASIGILFSLQYIKAENSILALGGFAATAIPFVVLIIFLISEGDPNRPKDPLLAKIYDLEQRASKISTTYTSEAKLPQF